jgi:uncharacterized SAM-binding protein YcdF (DUF218 family)
MKKPYGSSLFEVIWRRARWPLLFLSFAWLVAWASAEALIVRSDLPHADALLVLAGSATYRERTGHAARLFREGRASKIVLTNDNLQSGWSAAYERNPLFVERAMDELKRQGVPAESIEVVPGRVSSTYDEALQVRRYSAERGFHSVLIVTSGYQSRRARWAFTKVFRDTAITIGLDPVRPGHDAPRSTIWWSQPLGWELVPGEYLKMIYYKIHYR